ncbi:molecular chaperone [Pseudomonas nabeulensis]|uniref:Molecular chaperone n=1 Tax=Pseudomonas nabeulensis TaxID=2293833 RepID=A0A4Z0B662_9PSED|nr:molecular chaperone [Pseudomonas nabeulensis]TFY94220.1 molecular chaperone [Pseudomonas nabeulensis]
MKGWGLACLLIVGHAHAEVVLDRTRTVILTSAREATVQLTNEADSPRVIKLWIDAGDPQQPPEFADVPFTLPTPIKRIDAKKGLALRLIFHPDQAQHLATDRETVYWLNVLSVRPTVAGNAVHLAFRTRIKLFVRPESLPGRAEDAPGELRWRVVDGDLEVHNPSAYHVTLSSVAFNARRNDDPPMLAPYGTTVIPLKTSSDGTGLRFSSIDDHGTIQQHQVQGPLD